MNDAAQQPMVWRADRIGFHRYFFSRFHTALCFAKIPCALKVAQFPAAAAHPGYPFTLERQESLPEERRRNMPAYARMEEPGRFGDAAWFGLSSPIVSVV